jgi:DNA-binding transcriptional regulator YhcF (GntR family)
MGFFLDRRSPIPYAAQVQRQAMAQLVAGRLRPGDRLPSVRQFARDLHISRTTAERIQDALCRSMVAELRPRSGAYVAWPDTIERTAATEHAHEVYNFLKEVVTRSRLLGLDPARLAELVGSFEEGGAPRGAQRPVLLPVVATREGYETITQCVDDDFPARFVHISPIAPEVEMPRRARYLLSTYYMRERALKIAEALGCSLLCVRYNVKLLNESMTIPPGEHRYFITRDADNAETTKVFVASAYPEVPASRYTILPVEEWLALPRHQDRGGGVWATVTAAPMIERRVAPQRLRVLHPMLAPDFIDELRCLALFG